MPIFRYFSNGVFLDDFLEIGLLYFNSLSFFLDCEDAERKDPFEDVSVFAPKQGLEINRNASRIPIRLDSQFTSAVKNPHRIFIYCTSISRSSLLTQKFSATSIVRINDIDEFVRRIKKQLNNPLRRISERQFLHGPVHYYDYEEPPGIRWALPDEIVLSKTSNFSIEQEYRFAFSLDHNSFAPYNIDTTIGPKVRKLKKQNNHRILRIGNLRDICEVLNPNEANWNSSYSKLKKNPHCWRSFL